MTIKKNLLLKTKDKYIIYFSELRNFFMSSIAIRRVTAASSKNQFFFGIRFCDQFFWELDLVTSSFCKNWIEIPILFTWPRLLNIWFYPNTRFLTAPFQNTCVVPLHGPEWSSHKCSGQDKMRYSVYQLIRKELVTSSSSFSKIWSPV